MKYRREIDGLRAFAVVPVILFHAGFKIFSGGFVGVDVFFVISGYLITSILLAELETGKLSLAHFYERRARRILPALFLVMFTCLLFSWFWLLPPNFKSFSQSLVAVSLFASNFLFWRTNGYFEAFAEFKPLLHTWSLAVEEQYYVLFPLFLMLCWRLGKRRLALLLVAVTCLSLFAAQWATAKNPAFAFYLLPTRGWEILIGALIPFYPRKHNTAYNQPASPLGAALIIMFATPKTLTGRLWGSKLFVGIGLISYSAYLWHQPLFVFAKHKTVSDPSQGLMSILAVATFILAYFSWKYVEAPFRKKQHFTRQQIFLYAICGTIFFITIGLIGNFTKGIPQRYSTEEQTLVAMGTKEGALKLYGLGTCLIEGYQQVDVLISSNCIPNHPNKVIVFGDSEAAHLMAGVRHSFSNYAIGQWTGTGCYAIDYSKNSAHCREMYQTFLDHVLSKAQPSDIILISSRWIDLYNDIDKKEFSNGLVALLDHLKQAKAKIVIIGNTPEFTRSPQLIMVMEGIKNKGTVSLQSKDFREVNALLKSTAQTYGLTFFDPTTALCDALQCIVVNNGTHLFFDGGHLSTEGSVHVINGLTKTYSPSNP